MTSISYSTKKKKILLGLTTTPGSDWQEKIREITKFKIKEAALFPTFLEIKNRKKLYKLLEKTCLEKIPHIHLRDDTESWELDYCYQKFETRLFNIHSDKKNWKIMEKNRKYKKNIFVENGSSVDKQLVKMAEKCGGFCFDLAHFHDFAIIQKQKRYQKFLDSAKEIKIGCCHISAIKNNFEYTKNKSTGKLIKYCSDHSLSDLKELNYVKNYLEYLPGIISIELENSFKEQLRIKEYLEKLINSPKK